MFFEIELLILIVMLGSYVALMKLCKLSSGVSLMVSALLGMLLGTIFNGTPFSFRFFVEGSFSYLDTIITICVAMICISLMKLTGILDYFSTKIIRLLGKIPSLLVIVLALIVMFPAMVTGTAISSAVTTGAIVLPILIKWGVPKQKAAAFIVTESIIGQVCPPVNLPAMLICDVVDVAFNGFELPLLAMSIPLAIFSAIILTREYVKPITDENISEIVNVDIEKELNFTCLIPLLLVIVFMVAEVIWPKYLAIFGITLTFAVAAVLSIFLGKKTKFFTNFDDKESIVGNLLDCTKNVLPIAGILMGIGAFMAVFTLVGVRGYLALNCTIMPKTLQVIFTIILLPLLGGVSAYGSASIIGPSFALSFISSYDSVVLIAGLSLLASIGDFLPPTALSADYEANQIGEKSWFKVTTAGISTIIAMLVFGSLFSFIVSELVNGHFFGVEIGDIVGKLGNVFYLIVMLVGLVILGLTLFVYYMVKNPFNKNMSEEVK